MTTKLATLTELWQEFNLTGTQQLLDVLATEISTRQDESEASRKLLIELIRNFKKSNTEETRQLVAPLLKSFQNEIDSLSKRSKSAEKSFFDIYQKFCDIADPVPTLEYCMENMKSLQRMQDLEIENNQFRETLAECNQEITETKEQLKQLKDVEEKFRAQEIVLEETIEQRVKAREAELRSSYSEKSRAVEEEELRARHRLQEAQLKLKELQVFSDQLQAELFELRASQGERRSALAEETELVLTDLERAVQRAMAAEQEAAGLREQLELVRQAGEQQQPVLQEDESGRETAELRIQLQAKQNEVVQLVEDAQKTNKVIQENEIKYDKKVTELKATLVRVQTERDEKASKLELQADYESIKKDLSILKSLDFPSHSPEEEDTRPLEVLILERSKSLQADNSMLRQDKERLVAELGLAKQEASQARATQERQTELISQLEDHVEQLQTISTPYREEAEGRSSSDMLAEVLKLEGEDEVFQREGSLSPVGSTKLGDSSATLLPIVQAQRERLRLRNEELESGALQQQHQLATLTHQVSDLQQDNVKLYEKIRFLQSCGVAGRRREEAVVAVETRYQGEYEQKLDPFLSFSQAERKRKYGQLSVPERVILSLVRFIASNKPARLLFTFYSVLLHGLVFAVLWKLMMTESCKHDMAARWHEKYIEHMQDVHGDAEHVG